MGVPNQSIQVKYMLGDGQIRYGKAIEVYYGLYVRHIVLFHGERATYEIYSEKNGNVTTLHTGAVDYEDRESTEISRFGMLNRMMEYASANDGEALFSAMECYVKLEEASKSLFTPL